MSFPEGHWQPYRLPLHTPLPLQDPVDLQLDEPEALDEASLGLLAAGLGPVWDVPWAWHWSESGEVHVFRDDREVARLRVRPAGLVPGAGWQVVSLAHESTAAADAALLLLRDFLDAVAALVPVLRGVPARRADAVAASALPLPAYPHPPDVVATSLAARLPHQATALHLGSVRVPVPHGLSAVSAVVDGASVLVVFEDGARLWLGTARVSIDLIGLTAVASGALLWPGPDWPLPVPAVACSLTTCERRSSLRFRDRQGEELDVSAFEATDDVGVSNISLDLPWTQRP